MTEAEAPLVPEIVAQTERLLKYLHLNSVALSSDTQLMAREDLIPLVRLFDPTSGRYGYLPDERHYPEVYFVDTLCRFSGMTKVANRKLTVSKYGYLYLSRNSQRRLVMLVSAFVNDYPWFLMFPRGEMAQSITGRRTEVMNLLLEHQTEAKIEIAQFSEGMREHLEISLNSKVPPYPQLVLEWILRHILIEPLQRLGIVKLLNREDTPVNDIKEASYFLLTQAGRQLLASREVAYASRR